MSDLDLEFDQEMMEDDIGQEDWDDIFDDAEEADDVFDGAGADFDESDTSEPAPGEDSSDRSEDDSSEEVENGEEENSDTSEELTEEEEEARPAEEVFDEMDDLELDDVGEDVADALAGDEDEEDEIPDERPQELVDALKVEGLEEKMNLDEAVRAMKEAESEIATHENAKIMLRWRQGVIVANTRIVRGEQTMKRLSDECGTHENTLRYCRNLVEFFNYDQQKFKQWVDETSSTNGKGYVRWTKDIVKGLLRGDEDPETLGPEKYRDQAMSRVESTVQSLEKLNQHLQNVEDEDAHREVEGVTMRALDEIRRFMESEFYQDGTYDPQEVTPRSDQYLDFIRSMPSPISGSGPCIPHHRVRAGTGNKGSDFECIPLTQKEHDELHSMDEEAFWNQYGFTPGELANAYKHLYLTGVQNGVVKVPTPDNGLIRAKYVEQSDG